MNMIASFNPATGARVYETKASDLTSVQHAIRLALSAYPEWKNSPFQKRAEFLQRYKAAIFKKRAIIAEAISQEMGKPLWESLIEVDSMIAKVDISITAYHERCYEQIGEERALRFHPHGVVAVFGPFNFPGHLPNGHIVPALLAGNVVLFKPSEKTPLVGKYIQDAFDEAGFPIGVFQLLQGAKETAELIVNERDIAGIFFTGSVAAGRAIQQASFAFPKRIVAVEMGGNNPLIACEVADVQAALYLIIQSAFITSGQRCSCARRLIVTTDGILSPLVAAAKKIIVGPYTENPYMGPVVDRISADRLENSYKELLKAGGMPLLPLKRDGNYIFPTIVDMTGCELQDKEIFGPILQVIRTGNLDDAIEVANNTEFGLTASLISESYESYKTFYEKIQAGIVNWNMPTTGASSHQPFGGIGLSGNYRPSGSFAADYVSYPVSSQEKPNLSLPKTIPPGLIL